MGFSSRQRLRANLKRLFDDGVTTYSDLAQTEAVSNGTLGRVAGDDEAGHNLTLDKLDRLAFALKVEPWQLLHPDFDWANLSPAALKIAQKMESIAESHQDKAYWQFVQLIDFANIPATAADAASAHGTVKPRKLRKVPR